MADHVVPSELIEFDAPSRTWLLHTPETGYALRLAPDNSVRHVYWGPRLTVRQAAAVPLPAPSRDQELGEELPGEGGERFGPASLQVEFEDGTQAVQWRYVGHDLDGGHLRIRLADETYPLELDLNYQVLPDSDVLQRWTVLRHSGVAPAGPVSVTRLDSACWTLPGRPDWRLSHVVGEWSAEFQLRRVPAAYGETTLTSRRGTTRHQTNPWLMVDAGTAGEGHGEVWSTALAWSGTWRITVQRTPGDRLSVTGGAGHDAVRRQLVTGEQWRSPVYAGLYAADGFGGTSRRWHAYLRRHVLPAAAELRPVLYNSWEGAWFDVNVDNQIQLARVAAELGVELFVMDDGWFGARINDHAGLGDWWPNPDRFPDGLSPLADEVHRLGMRFGVWVEPEMVNPDSDLYRAHPEWVLHMPNRIRTELRNQFVLNFARSDVTKWAHSWLDTLVADNDIDFLKWDMNRAFTEAGWPSQENAGQLWFGHTSGVYEVIDRLRANHPGLRIETCASGGGRVDLGILARTDQAWTSDNTDPVDRIHIQHGYSQLYPAITMGAWASESPNPVNQRATPVRFRFHVAMAGALGISGNLVNWPATDRREAAALVAEYKRVRHVIQHGDLYRLTPPSAQDTTAVQYLSADGSEVVLLVWRAAPQYGAAQPVLRLSGLDPRARYVEAGTGVAHDGAVLLHHGLVAALPEGDHASAMVHLQRG